MNFVSVADKLTTFDDIQLLRFLLNVLESGEFPKLVIESIRSSCPQMYASGNEESINM